MELVTLEAPDGRRYKTDSKAEINLLIGTYGYSRVSDPQGSRRSKSAPAPKRAPEPPPPAPAPDGSDE